MYYVLREAIRDFEEVISRDKDIVDLALKVNPEFNVNKKIAKEALKSAYHILIKLTGMEELYIEPVKQTDEMIICERFYPLLIKLATFYLMEDYNNPLLEYMRYELTALVNNYTRYIKTDRVYIGEYEMEEMVKQIKEDYNNNEKN